MVEIAEARDREGSRRIGSLRALLPFFRPHLGMVAAAAVALVATACVSLVLPLAVRRVVDGFQTGASELLDSYFVAAFAIAGALALGTGLRYYLVTRVGERVVADIRKATFGRMIGMSPAFYDGILTGEVLSRITTDTTLLLSVIGSSVSVALRNSLLLVGGLGLMVWTAPKLSGLVILLVPAVVVPILVLGRRLRTLSRENQDWIAESSGRASEWLLSAQTVQAYTFEDAARGRFDDVTEKSFVSARTRIRVRAVMTVIVILVTFSGVVGVLWIGARDVRADVMTIGELIQFLIYAIIVAGSVAALSEIWGELQRAAGATERLVELLEARDTVSDPAAPAPVPGGEAVAFEDVTFRYPTRPGVAALDGVTLRVEPGETVALVGPSGAGKSTAIALLQRFYDPDGGRITLGGTDLRDMDRAAFRVAHRAGAAGPGDLRRIGARQHPLRRARRDGRAGRGGRAGGGGARLPRGAPRRLRHLCGRARRDAVGRAEAARGDRARDPARRAGAAAGRGDLGARRRIRARGAGRGRPPRPRAHHDHRRPPARHREAGRPDRGDGARTDRRAGHARPACRAGRALRAAGAAAVHRRDRGGVT